jgi:hypothetical protein
MATLLVTTGKAVVTSRIGGGGTTPQYVAWGTGAGTTAAADTTLFTESASPASRATGTTSQVTTTTTNDTYQVVGTLTSGTTQTITNAGVFDAVTVGNLFVKGDFTGLALSSGDSIQFTFKVQFS